MYSKGRAVSNAAGGGLSYLPTACTMAAAEQGGQANGPARQPRPVLPEVRQQERCVPGQTEDRCRSREGNSARGGDEVPMPKRWERVEGAGGGVGTLLTRRLSCP